MEYASAENLRDAVAGARRAACAGEAPGYRAATPRGFGTVGPVRAERGRAGSPVERVRRGRGAQEAGGGVPGRRGCDASSLVRQLNLFFTRAEVARRCR